MQKRLARRDASASTGERMTHAAQTVVHRMVSLTSRRTSPAPRRNISCHAARKQHDRPHIGNDEFDTTGQPTAPLKRHERRAGTQCAGGPRIRRGSHPGRRIGNLQSIAPMSYCDYCSCSFSPGRDGSRTRCSLGGQSSSSSSSCVEENQSEAEALASPIIRGP